MPSPKRHSTTLGSAVTVTVSPASVTVSSSTVGAGSSQNQETAPVSPVSLGRCPNPAGQERQPIGDRGGEHSRGRRPVRPGRRACSRARACRVRRGRHDPARAVYQKLPGPSGSGFWAKDESSRSGGYGLGRSTSAGRRDHPTSRLRPGALLPTPHRGADTGPGSVVLLRVAADRDDGRPGFAGRLPHVRCGARGERERGDGAEDDQRGSG